MPLSRLYIENTQISIWKRELQDFKLTLKTGKCFWIYTTGAGFHTGYYKQHNGRNMLSLDRPNHAGVPAVVVNSRRGRKIEGTALTDLKKGDVLELGAGKKE